MNVLASAIDACSAEQCIRHFFCFPVLNSGGSKGAAEMPKKRINVHIDDLNLYHSILQHTHPDYRWLNLLA